MAAEKMNIIASLDTDHAKLVLDVGMVTLGEKIRAEMNEQQQKEQNRKVLVAVCALLNSGGGKIKAKIENPGYSLERDGIGQDLTNSFRNLLQSVRNYVDFIQEEGHFLIFVKSWSPGNSPLLIVTLETNVYERSLSSSVEMNAADALEFLKSLEQSGGRLCSRPELPAKGTGTVQEELFVETLASNFLDRKLTYMENFSFTESTHVEFKSFETNNLLKRLKEILPRTVSAFANTEGGYLFVGLDEKKQQIIGFKAEMKDLKQLKSEIERYIDRLPVYHFCKEKKGLNYKIRFMEVHDDAGSVCSYVCALRVERFCCAVFAKEPDSWLVKDSGVKAFTTEEWVMRMCGRAPPPSN
uniref:schlafen family member 12-like n=1 Tax=Jaculus jaculus TaxID=51337 RepID=UPI001E1B1FFB|nr:schlafen family member 12-like [Jaculus jaculus]